MSILRAQTQFPMFTGIPRDVISNTIHFDWDETLTLADAATEIASRLTTFYTSAYNGGVYRANYVNWANGTVEVSDLSGPTPRIPEVRSVIPTGAAAASTLPTEVACVLTFAAAETGGVVRQRLYNRIYLGGLEEACMTAGSAATFPAFGTPFMDFVGNAAAALLLENDTFLSWIQYSPTAGVARPITRGWVDNAPDTQRRRSVEASTRSTWLP
jgi:hypothetical protein